MNAKKISLANNIYLILAGLFITSLVASNLIFTKIFYWYPFDINLMGAKLFELSVGILPYPLTFLITDSIIQSGVEAPADIPTEFTLLDSQVESISAAQVT